MIRVLVSLLFVAILSGGCVSGVKDDAAVICDGNSKSSVYLVVELFLDTDSPVGGEMKIDSFSLTDGSNVYTPDMLLTSSSALWGGNYRLPLTRGSLRSVYYPIDDISSFAGLSLQVYYSCFYDSDAGCGLVEVMQSFPLQVAEYLFLAGAFERYSFKGGVSLPFVLKCRCVVASRRRFFFL